MKRIMPNTAAAATLGMLALVLLLLPGCPDDVLPPDNDNSGSPPDPNGPVSYAFDIQPIFDKHCVQCHRNGGIAERLFGIPLHLSSGQARGELVNQRSVQDSSWVLVVPGDPENSLLYRKVADANPPVGGRMPLFQPPLEPQEIEFIRAWIAGGALAN